MKKKCVFGQIPYPYFWTNSVSIKVFPRPGSYGSGRHENGIRVNPTYKFWAQPTEPQFLRKFEFSRLDSFFSQKFSWAGWTQISFARRILTFFVHFLFRDQPAELKDVRVYPDFHFLSSVGWTEKNGKEVCFWTNSVSARRYTANTNHWNLTDSVSSKWKT